jgi:hypothetical protein
MKRNLFLSLFSIIPILTYSLNTLAAEPVLKYDHLDCRLVTTDNQPAIKFELYPIDQFGSHWILHSDERVNFKNKTFQVTATLELREERVVRLGLGLAELKNEKGNEVALWKAETGTFSTNPNAPDFSLTVRGYPTPIDFSSPYVYFDFSCYTIYRNF